MTAFACMSATWCTELNTHYGRHSGDLSLGDSSRNNLSELENQSREINPPKSQNHRAVDKMLRQVSVLFFAAALPPALSLKVQQHASKCVSLAMGTSNGRGIINATFIAAGGLSVDGVNNTVPFCRIFATEKYALNNSVLYEVWLPEQAEYSGCYLSVGKHLPTSASTQDTRSSLWILTRA